MSRRDSFDLAKIIDEYKKSKDEENHLKKVNNEMNENIKSYMSLHNMTEASSNRYTATITTTNKESLNEELAIEIIKEHLGGALLNSVVKTKEYIDEDALEKLVYNGDFDPVVLTKAKIVKPITTLRISKKKE